MHLSVEKAIVVMDAEGRRKLFNVSKGDIVKILDKKGHFHTGCIERVFNELIIIRNEEGKSQKIFLDRIEHIQKRGEEA